MTTMTEYARRFVGAVAGVVLALAALSGATVAVSWGCSAVGWVPVAIAGALILGFIVRHAWPSVPGPPSRQEGP